MEADLQHQTTSIVDHFLRRYKCYWESGADPRTAAVMVHLRAPCLVRSQSLMVVARRYDFAMVYPQGSTERKIFEVVAKPFRRSSPV